MGFRRGCTSHIFDLHYRCRWVILCFIRWEPTQVDVYGPRPSVEGSLVICRYILELPVGTGVSAPFVEHRYVVDGDRDADYGCTEGGTESANTVPACTSL